MGLIGKAARLSKRVFGTTLKKGSHAKVKKILRSGGKRNKSILKAHANAKTVQKIFYGSAAATTGYMIANNKRNKK